MFRGLVSKFKAAQDKHQRITQFRAAFNEAAADGVLTEAELQDLEDTLAQLDLTGDDISHLKVRLAEDVIDRAIDDRRISPEEQEGILDFLERFKVPQESLRQKLALFGHYRKLYAIEQGHLPELRATSIIPRKGEVVHYRASADTLEEKVVDSYYVGQSSGVSVRVAKGVSYRVGSSRGRKVEQRALVTTSSGALHVTSQRLVYDSRTKPLELKLDKLLNMQVYYDGVLFGVSNRKAPVFFRLSPEDAEGVAVTLAAVVNKANA